MKQYKNITTNEIVQEEDAEDYVLNVLGLRIEPRGKNGEMTVMQLENIESTVDWFFSGNWIEEEIPLEDNIDEYQERLNYEFDRECEY